MNFITSRNGYDTKQVDEYIKKLSYDYEKQIMTHKDKINALLDENRLLKDKLLKYTSKESSISGALMVAVEKAKEIEDDSKKVYELEIQRLRLLFNKYKTLLDKMIEDNPNPNAKSVQATKKVVEEFRESINETLSRNYSVMAKNVSAYDPMRNLLSKMQKYMEKRNQETSAEIKKSDEKWEDVGKKKVASAKTSKNDFDKNIPLHSDKVNIKPIADINLNKGDKFENLVDKFLEVGDGEEKNALAKKIMQSSGFDLKEAVNPTEDLEEIMKFFDFYEGE